MKTNKELLSPIICGEVFFAYKDNKVGVIHKNLKNYNIPIKYDRIIYDDEFIIKSNNADVIAYVESNDKWGAYCYMVDFHERYSNKTNKTFEQEYVRKRFIPPLFDSIKVIYDYNSAFETMFFIVSINGKYGILDAYNKRFIVPIIFDRIDNIKITYMGVEVYGEIDGKHCISKGHEVQVLTSMDVSLSDEYKLIRRKIEKRED